MSHEELTKMMVLLMNTVNGMDDLVDCSIDVVQKKMLLVRILLIYMYSVYIYIYLFTVYDTYV